MDVTSAPCLHPYRAETADFDDLMGLPIKRLRSVDGIEFDLDEPARYIVSDGRYTLPIDFVLYPTPGEQLLVGFHGAEVRSSTSLPKFQFVQTMRARGGPSIAFSDSTLLKSERLSIGWFAGDAATPLADLVGSITSQAAAALGVRRTILLGHSAGGFAAIRVGMLVPNSRAVAVNAQAVAKAHRPWVVNNICADSFEHCGSPEEMLEMYPDRFDLRVAAENREPSSSFTFFSHKDDRLSFRDHPHFPLLSEHFGLDDSGGITDHGDALVPCSWELSNPNAHALPGTVLPFVQLVLGEKPSRRIEFAVNPQWVR